MTKYNIIAIYHNGTSDGEIVLADNPKDAIINSSFYNKVDQKRAKFHEDDIYGTPKGDIIRAFEIKQMHLFKIKITYKNGKTDEELRKGEDEHEAIIRSSFYNTIKERGAKFNDTDEYMEYITKNAKIIAERI